jgi:hypothetical protein
MTREPQRPIFGFIFAVKPDSPGSGQVRWIRLPGRGPWRLFTLIIATLVILTVFGAALFSIAGSRTVVEAVVAIAIATIVAGFGGLLTRAWIVGTYVNDSGVRITRWTTTEFLPWESIQKIEIHGSRARQRVLLRVTDSNTVATTISSVDADTLLRPRTWEATVDRLSVWLHENKRDRPSSPAT